MEIFFNRDSKTISNDCSYRFAVYIIALKIVVEILLQGRSNFKVSYTFLSTKGYYRLLLFIFANIHLPIKTFRWKHFDDIRYRVRRSVEEAKIVKRKNYDITINRKGKCLKPSVLGELNLWDISKDSAVPRLSHIQLGAESHPRFHHTLAANLYRSSSITPQATDFQDSVECLQARRGWGLSVISPWGVVRRRRRGGN